MGFTVTDRVLADFAGRWSLARTITPAQGPMARFEGQAVWTPVSDGLAYLEEGQLHLTGQPPMAATRRYLWRADMSVWFDDGRLFHTIPPAGGATAHWCDPDQYDGGYDFADWPRFAVTWRVRGPAKDYTMVSRYERLD